MKKTIIHIVRRRIVAFTPVFVLLAMSALFSTADLAANEWGPSFGPSFPEETETFAKNGSMDDFVPATISNVRSTKRLPTRSKPVGHSRMAAFDMPPEPNTAIIPQGFFDEEPTPTVSSSPSLPKRLKKDRSIHETEKDSVARPADASANEFSFQDEIVDGTIYADDGSVVNYGGDYESMLPAMDGYYSGPLMMKPFGTGMMDNLTIFGGATGFKSRLDAGGNGNFGFQEGFNWAGPATPQCTISGQLGFRAVQSNLNGAGAASNKRMREQYFATAGVFKRDLAYPVQGGVVFDWMEDDFYGKVKVRQFRYELSARTFSNVEYGILGGFGVTKKGTSFIDWREDPTGRSHYGIEAQQYYLLFLRKHFCGGGVAEFRLGATEYGDFLLSSLGEFPLNDRLTLNGGFSAMIPEEGRSRNGFRRESWELSVGFVFYFRGGACSKPCNPCRPMFDVAGNGSFFNRIVRK